MYYVIADLLPINYTFPINSEQEFESLQLRTQNLGLRNLKVPSGNSMGSK